MSLIQAVNNTKYEKDCSELHLGRSGIEKISNFEGFANLEELYLNENRLTALTGLESNFRLKGLYLQNNQITTLEGSCITILASLEKLNLANNLVLFIANAIVCWIPD